MKKNRLIFYGIFVAYHLFIFFFSLYMDGQKENVQFLFSLQKKIGLLKYGSFLGLALIAVDMIWLLREDKKKEQEKQQLVTELNNLKAKLYDIQESSRKTPPAPEQNSQNS